jgi:hypothetical protein
MISIIDLINAVGAIALAAIIFGLLAGLYEAVNIFHKSYFAHRRLLVKHKLTVTFSVFVFQLILLAGSWWFILEVLI